MAEDRVSYLHSRDPSIDRSRRVCPKKKFKLLDRVAELDADFNDDDYDENNENSSSTANSSEQVKNGGLINSFGGSQQSIDSSDSGATVYLRLRPLPKPSPLYTVENNVLKVHNIEQSTTNNKDLTEKHYEFSNIFDNDASQHDIYETCVRSYIDNDESLTLLTYGTSGSGKTFTMHGDNMNAGIIPRAIEHIFTRYKYMISSTPGVKFDKGNIMLVDESNYPVEERLRARFISGDTMHQMNDVDVDVKREHDFESITVGKESVVIWLSFAEIYNENVYDLLSVNEKRPNKPRKNLKIISNQSNAFIKDLTSVNVRTAQEAYAVFSAGLEQANTASTNINMNSSRSHCIFMVNVILYTPPGEFSFCVYKFCDLAGSERLKKTENVGNRLKEAQRINCSLLVLGRCLDLLYANQQKKSKEVVPFRESKLTLLLQKSLMGREKITTIVNMMPKTEFIEENLHVLHFASIAQKIVFKPPKPLAAPIAAAAAPKRRSTRFSWFVARDQTSKYYIAEEDVLSLREEIDELQIENERLLDVMEKQRQEAIRNEQTIRTTLVSDFEKQMQNTNELWEQRLNWIEQKDNEKVGFDFQTIYFMDRSFLDVIPEHFCRFQIKRLEEEIEMLRKQLSKHQQLAANVIEIDDDDEDDAEYDSDESDESNTN